MSVGSCALLCLRSVRLGCRFFPAVSSFLKCHVRFVVFIHSPFTLSDKFHTTRFVAACLRSVKKEEMSCTHRLQSDMQVIGLCDRRSLTDTFSRKSADYLLIGGRSIATPLEYSEVEDMLG